MAITTSAVLGIISTAATVYGASQQKKAQDKALKAQAQAREDALNAQKQAAEEAAKDRAIQLQAARESKDVGREGAVKEDTGAVVEAGRAEETDSRLAGRRKRRQLKQSTPTSLGAGGLVI